MLNLADEDLMQLVRRGDSAAFEVVYERHATAAFLSLWRSGAPYDRARGSVRTWVLGIVHNRAIDALRRSLVHSRRRASDEGIEERFEAKERTDAEAARNDEAREVHAALRTGGRPPLTRSISRRARSASRRSPAWACPPTRWRLRPGRSRRRPSSRT